MPLRPQTGQLSMARDTAGFLHAEETQYQRFRKAKSGQEKDMSQAFAREQG
jgi:hypothetical protein